MKKTNLLSSFIALILSSNYANANTVQSNCTVSELNKNQPHFCLIQSDDYYIKEVLNQKDGANKYQQYQRIQQIEEIPESLFEEKFQFENHNGVGVIKTENGDFYTFRVGYIQENGHYLSLKNNVISPMKLENIKNIKKVIAKDKIFALDENGTLFKKENNEWININIKNVYDFVYLDDKKLFIISKSGVYYNSEKDSTFKKALLEIDENLYKDKIEENEYYKYVEKSIYNKYSTFVLNDNELDIRNSKMKNKDFEIQFIKNKIIISNDFGFDQNGISYRDAKTPNTLYPVYFNNDDKNVKSKYSFEYDTDFLVYDSNIIKTKYNGNILVNNNEELIVNYNSIKSPISKYEYYSQIVMSSRHGDYYFSLRDNGMLTITNIKSKQTHVLYHINRIDDLGYDIAITVDPTYDHIFKSKAEKLKLLDLDKNKIKGDKIRFRFKDFKTLENKKLNKLINP